MSRIILALALACSASAFMVPGKVPRKLGTVRTSMVATSPAAAEPTVTPKTPATPAYPGLKLPYNEGATEENSQPEVQALVNQFGYAVFAAGPSAVWPTILAGGKLKSDLSSLDPVKKLLKDTVPGLNDMPETYKTFGGDDYAAQLCVILETNPFYAASLTPRAGGGFKLINYDPVGEDATYSTRVMRTIGRNGPQVNVKFSVKPEGGLAIDGFDIFEKGVKVEQSAEHDNYWASVVLYDLFFVAQTMHASIHIFHYVLTNALRYASKDYRRLNNWADEYNGNVNYKYDQVSNLLVNLKGDGILTSSKGLGGSAQTLDIMVGNIAAWGHCSTGTEFHDVWFQSPRKDLEAAGLLTEYFKHTDLGAGCAVSATAALEKTRGRSGNQVVDDLDKLDDTNEKLATFISKSGAWPAEENGIKTVRSLLDMMMITGIIHGGTLSMTRLPCKPEILRWRNIDEPKWTPDDLKTSLAACGTIVGAQKNKHACGNKKSAPQDDDGPFDDITGGSLQKVLDDYDHDVGELKKVYYR